MNNDEMRLNVRIQKDVYSTFKELCADNAINPSALIRKWIIAYIEENKK